MVLGLPRSHAPAPNPQAARNASPLLTRSGSRGPGGDGFPPLTDDVQGWVDGVQLNGTGLACKLLCRLAGGTARDAARESVSPVL